jgi:hypothetical protein
MKSVRSLPLAFLSIAVSLAWLPVAVRGETPESIPIPNANCEDGTSGWELVNFGKGEAGRIRSRKQSPTGQRRERIEVAEELATLTGQLVTLDRSASHKLAASKVYAASRRRLPLKPVGQLFQEAFAMAEHQKVIGARVGAHLDPRARTFHQLGATHHIRQRHAVVALASNDQHRFVPPLD